MASNDPVGGGNFLFPLAADEMELMGPIAVERRVVARLFHRSNPAEPVRPCTKSVAVVIDKSMLGG